MCVVLLVVRQWEVDSSFLVIILSSVTKPPCPRSLHTALLFLWGFALGSSCEVWQATNSPSQAVSYSCSRYHLPSATSSSHVDCDKGSRDLLVFLMPYLYSVHSMYSVNPAHGLVWWPANEHMAFCLPFMAEFSLESPGGCLRPSQHAGSQLPASFPSLQDQLNHCFWRLGQESGHSGIIGLELTWNWE